MCALPISAMGRSRATHYRKRRGPGYGPPAPRRSHRRLSDEEQEAVVETLNCERFCDRAPAQVWATLLDEGIYLASISTMYRLPRAGHRSHLGSPRDVRAACAYRCALPVECHQERLGE